MGARSREQILAATLTPPEATTHWSRARLAKRVGVSPSTVGRVWAEGRLKPHRVETFKYSRDPQLTAKITDVVGLYLAPPERAIVLSVDEKTQIQALDRTQPMLPLRPGQVERHTHDYKRNGTLSLFAALEVATGQVTNQARERHTADDFLAFLRLLARTYRRGEVHVVLDNVSTHKTPDVVSWLAKHPRFTFHFTPTSASWMNQVETWFGILTRQALRRGSFENVRVLTAAIERFTREWNAGATPFTWVKTADEILAKAVRKTQARFRRATLGHRSGGRCRSPGGAIHAVSGGFRDQRRVSGNPAYESDPRGAWPSQRCSRRAARRSGGSGPAAAATTLDAR